MNILIARSLAGSAGSTTPKISNVLIPCLWPTFRPDCSWLFCKHEKQFPVMGEDLMDWPWLILAQGKCKAK